MSEIDNGGYAFPGAQSFHHLDTGGMSTRHTDGMTLRDWFAGQALPALLEWHPADLRVEQAPAKAYRIADAMLAARKEGR